MQVLCLHGPRKSKPRVKSELCKQQFLTTIIWHTQEFLGKYKIYVLLYSFALFYFESEGKYLPRTYIRRVDLTEGDFCVTSLGGLYIEGLIFGILRYLIFYNSENKPRALYFSKAFFERFIFRGAHTAVGGAYLRREICVSKSIGLSL